MEFRRRRKLEFPGRSVQGSSGQRVDSTQQFGQSLDGVSGRLVDLSKPRHAGLFQAAHQLDAQLDESARRRLADWIREQYTTDYGDFPLGWVAVCGLGAPYVDHRLDLTQAILDHYAPADPMPEPYARARMLVRTGAYPLVEVYASGRLVPVGPDGVVWSGSL